MAWKGILFAFKIVSIRDVAVMICEDPAVSDVYRKSLGSFSSDERSTGAAMMANSLPTQLLLRRLG